SVDMGPPRSDSMHQPGTGRGRLRHGVPVEQALAADGEPITCFLENNLATTGTSANGLRGWDRDETSTIPGGQRPPKEDNVRDTIRSALLICMALDVKIRSCGSRDLRSGPLIW